MPRITPNLWFDSEGLDAAKFYVSVFPNSEVTEVTHYPEDAPKPGSVLTVNFLLDGQEYTAINGGPQFTFDEAISLLIILPIALPGIITGISLRAAFSMGDVPFSFWTIVLGHATFCIVVVYNNAVARLRRTSPSLIEASMDLGADSFQTFRHVILPNLATALLAGGMLAFALSFDEVIVTTFTAGQQQTLPIWMLNELVRPRQRPVTNVVAVLVIAVTLIQAMVAFLCTLAGSWLAFPMVISSVVSTVLATWGALDVWVTRQVWNQRNGVKSSPSSAARAVRRERRTARRSARRAARGARSRQGPADAATAVRRRHQPRHMGA